MIVVAAAAIVAPAVLTAHPAGASGTATAQAQASDVSAAKKKARKPAKKKEEFLKTAPSAPPKGDKSTY
jgi:hypothetical protein